MERQFQAIAEIKASLADLIKRSDDAIKRSQEIMNQLNKDSKRIQHLPGMRTGRLAK